MLAAKKQIELVSDLSDDDEEDSKEHLLNPDDPQDNPQEEAPPTHLDAIYGTGQGNIDPTNAHGFYSEYTIDEAISYIGLGCFQFKLIMITGVLWSTDAMEMMIITILQPVLIDIWELDELSKGTIAMCVYGGMLVGTYTLGTISDRIGRRLIVAISIIGYSLFSLLCAFSVSYYMFLIMRFLLGIFIGGGAVGFTLFAEFSPTEKRGRMLVIQQAFWCFGAIFASLLGWLCMEYLNWRYFLMFTSIPLWLVSLFVAWLPESPHYLMAIGKYSESIDTLKRIAKDNNSFIPSGYLQKHICLEEQRGQLKDVFVKKYRKTSILLYLTLITSVFSYFGLSFIGERIFISDSGDQYKENLLTAFGEIPALVIGIFVIDKIGRKPTLNMCFIIYSCVCFLLFFSAIREINTFGVILIFVGRTFASLAFMTQYIYFSEYYPTVIRATAIGCASSLDEISKIVANYLAEDMDISLAMVVFGFVGCVSLTCSFFLTETKGKQLNEEIDRGSQMQMHTKGTIRVKLNEKL